MKETSMFIQESRDSPADQQIDITRDLEVSVP